MTFRHHKCYSAACKSQRWGQTLSCFVEKGKGGGESFTQKSTLAFHVSVGALPGGKHDGSWLTSPKGQPRGGAKWQAGPGVGIRAFRRLGWVSAKSEVDGVLLGRLIVLLPTLPLCPRWPPVPAALGLPASRPPASKRPPPIQVLHGRLPAGAWFCQSTNLLDAETGMAAGRLIRLLARRRVCSVPDHSGVLTATSRASSPRGWKVGGGALRRDRAAPTQTAQLRTPPHSKPSSCFCPIASP